MADPRGYSRRSRFLGFLDVSVACLTIMFVLERPAHAYIDPGAGAMLWQVLVGLFAGTIYYVSRFFAGFRKRKGDKDDK